MKKTILLVICVIFLFVSITSCSKSSKQKEDVSLFRVVQNGKYGFIDKTGKIVINTKFNIVLSFEEGLSGVKVGDKWGFIDKKAKIVINPQFDKVSYFSEGLSDVKVGDK
jgi:hypothetical protein